MTREELFEVLGDVGEKYVTEARRLKKPKKPAWMKAGAAAACFFLVILLYLAFTIPKNSADNEKAERDTQDPVERENTVADADGPPNMKLNGRTFYVSSYSTVSEKVPEGFSYAGETKRDGEELSYYLNPDIPEWVYLYQEVLTDGTVDETGTLTRTEPHMAYVRYVDERLRGKHLLSCDGRLYIDMWSASYYDREPDVSLEFYEAVETEWGIRLNEEIPEGFQSVGVAEFSGYDTIPSGVLASNMRTAEVFVNPNKPQVVLMATEWYTAAKEENGETKHTGYDVYILYDGPLK